MTAVSAHGLTRRFGPFTAVDQVSFDIPSGEVFGLLGPNGAGKTTVIRLLCGIYAASEGRATVLGFDLGRDRDRIRARIGYMSQRFSLYGELTVDENLGFYARVYGRPDRLSIDRACDAVGLSRQGRSARVDSLPTGLRQRAALAAAVVHEPELVFLDEPTSGVDPLARQQFWSLIAGLAAGGTTIVVTTHVMTEATGCTRLGLMAAGRVVALGTPDELIDRAGVMVAVVDAEPWQGAYALLKRRWPATDLYGRLAHVPIAGHAEEVEGDLRQRLAGLDVRRISIERPTLEDAFIRYVEAASAARP